MHDPTADPTLRLLATHTVVAVGDLLELHLALAKAEVARAVRTTVAGLAPLLLAVPLLLFAWVLANAAAVAALRPILGDAGGLASIAAVNALLGIAAGGASLRALRGPGPGATFVTELTRTARVLVGAAPESVDVH